MAWPQSPQPAPAPPPAAPAGDAFPLDGVVTVISGALTFLFSFVRIAKFDGADIGWSVWTTSLGLFGVGTWIPLFGLVAAGIAAARWVVKGIDDKEVLGFRAPQLQLVASTFAFLLVIGYFVSILFSGGDFEVDLSFGGGSVLLLISTIGLMAGSVLGLGVLEGMPTLGGTDQAAPPYGAGQPAPGQPGAPTPPPPAGGQWAASDPYAAPAAPAAPVPPSGEPAPPAWDQTIVHGAPAPGTWDQPAAPAPAPPEWQQPDAPVDTAWQAPAPPPVDPQWQQPAAPADQQWSQPPAEPQWQQPPAAGGEPAPWEPQPAPPGPQPEPGPLDPQPSPPADPAPPSEGGLFDPGTQVIPGPPPAPPPDDPQQPPPS